MRRSHDIGCKWHLFHPIVNHPLTFTRCADYAPLQIGTPRREFNILMDSGSADFWVGSANCSTRNGNCVRFHGLITLLSDVQGHRVIMSSSGLSKVPPSTLPTFNGKRNMVQAPFGETLHMTTSPLRGLRYDHTSLALQLLNRTNSQRLSAAPTGSHPNLTRTNTFYLLIGHHLTDWLAWQNQYTPSSCGIL